MIGWLYAQIGNIRNSLFEKGLLKTYPLGAPTISVGNITMGGTGKTPLVAYISKILADSGKKVCILSRGYGRESTGRILVSDGESVLSNAREAGDEPFELAQKLLGKAIIIADADRISAAAWANEKFDIDVFVLDDAFQHRRAQRDLDIVCIDATNPFGKGIKNLLRESPKNLRRADAVVITRADLCEDVDDLRLLLAHFCPKNIFTSRNKISRISPIAGDGASVGLEGKKVLAFCAIGNPASFFAQLRLAGSNLVAEKAFRDHHYYGQTDVLELEKTARESGAEVMLTTVKDAGKLTELKFESPCLRVESETVIDDSNTFRELIYSVLS
jgi:tetraacyldisaccharide 4'-kinase